jgi:acyl-CoA-dependent ceramide synthase
MAKETAAPAQSAPELPYVSSSRPAKETTFREWVVVNQIGKISTNTTMLSSAVLKALKAQLPAQLLPGSFGSRKYLHSANSWLCAAGISLTILAMLLALHNLYPSLRPYTQPFFELSYYDSATNSYVQGWDDVYFVVSAALALTAIRAIAIEWILEPLARYAGLKRKGAVRLAEQGWQALYYGFIWGVGLVRAFRGTVRRRNVYD